MRRFLNDIRLAALLNIQLAAFLKKISDLRRFKKDIRLAARGNVTRLCRLDSLTFETPNQIAVESSIT